MNEVAGRIAGALRIGAENAVSLSMMCRYVSLPERETRAEIERMRRSGAVICSSEQGYFLPARRSELEAYVARERSRSRAVLASIAAAERLLERWRDDNG